MVSPIATSCASEGRFAFHNAKPRKAQGKQFLLEPAINPAELMRGATESLNCGA